MISTKICTIKLPYSFEYTEEQLKAMQKFNPNLRFKRFEDFERSDKEKTEEELKSDQQKAFDEYMSNPRRELHDSYSKRELIVDIVEFMNDCPFINFEVEKVHKITNAEKYSNLTTIIAKFEELSKGIIEGIEKFETFNNKVDVHIAGSLLLTVNELLLKEDCCTDEIQTDLSSGWRIVAVCVQPDGRRPDYILGRYNPEKLKDFDYAKRES